MGDNTEGRITAGQAAARLLTSAEALHITDSSGLILWAGTGKEWAAGADRNRRPMENLRERSVRHIGATWDTIEGRAAVMLTV